MPNSSIPSCLPLSRHKLIDEIERLREELASTKADSKFRQELHNTLSGAMNIGYWEWDEIKHRPIFLSKEMANILGISQKALYDRFQCYEDYFQFIHPEDKIRVRNSQNVVLDSGDPCGGSHTFDYRIIRPGGEVRSIRELEYGILDEHGTVIRTYGAIQDISDQSRSDQALKQSEQRYSSIVSQLPLGVQEQDWSRIKIEIDKLQSEGVSDLEAYLKDNPFMLRGFVDTITIVSVNDALLKIYDTKSAELYIETEENVAHWWDQSFVNLYASEIAAFAGPDKVHHQEIEDTREDGSAFVVRFITRVVEGDEDAWKRILTIAEDVTERNEAQEKLSYQASHDSLTGLINRHEFERRAERLIHSAQSNAEEHALCFMDLDRFKIINDTCGHTAGDELLRQLATLLRGTVRKQDALARLGGDEFGVLMENCTLEQARRVTELLESAVRDFHFGWDEHSFRISASIGLVTIDESSPNLGELLKRADAACYMAKDLGRNRTHVYHAEDTELAQRHGEMQWVARINRALEDNQYCLYAQPIVPLNDSGERHYEVLLRMIDETGKTIPPGAFLPAAERYDLMHNLDRWVVKNALALLARNPAFVEETNSVSINLSGQSVTSGEFLDFIMKQLKKTGIEAGKICFEITETVAISNLTKAKTFITRLQDFGCSFALDDFGSGLSSFGYLKNLPVDYLKIDGMFVKDIVDDPIDRAMVKSINDIGQVMGMQTIAEFVENDEIKRMLREIGVNYAQGYGVGMPLPFVEIIEQTDVRVS